MGHVVVPQWLMQRGVSKINPWKRRLFECGSLCRMTHRSTTDNAATAGNDDHHPPTTTSESGGRRIDPHGAPLLPPNAMMTILRHGPTTTTTEVHTAAHVVTATTTASTAAASVVVVLAFGISGWLNNCAYVIMLATAKYMSEGGVAAVYIANILPGLAVQVSAPYWFDTVSYQTRIRWAAIAMGLAFVITAYFSHRSGVLPTNVVLIGQLVGVAIISFQCGLGEASLLALAGKWDSRQQQQHENMDAVRLRKKSKGHCLSAFSTGTGAAGPLGYLWKIAFTEWMGLSVPASLFLAAIILSLSYGIIGNQLVLWSLDADHRYARLEDGAELLESNADSIGTFVTTPDNESNEEERVEEVGGLIRDEISPSLPELADLSACERCRLLLTMCWPYMIPLFTVYAAEYACQAGAWTAIGFPVSSTEARTEFYEQSNWLYQAGVFVSRSTGSLFTMNLTWLWILPAVQVVNLILFSMTASTGVSLPHHFLYHKSTLLPLSFFTGLLGGAVYVHGYQRIVADVPKQYTEFAISSTSVAESLGVLVADISGLFLQSCLYRSNHLHGALVRCPV
jgi:battenin